MYFQDEPGIRQAQWWRCMDHYEFGKPWMLIFNSNNIFFKKESKHAIMRPNFNF